MQKDEKEARMCSVIAIDGISKLYVPHNSQLAESGLIALDMETRSHQHEYGRLTILRHDSTPRRLSYFLRLLNDVVQFFEIQFSQIISLPKWEIPLPALFEPISFKNQRQASVWLVSMWFPILNIRSFSHTGSCQIDTSNH